MSKRHVAWQLLKDTINSCMEYRILGLAAEAAFFTLLSLPPLLLALIGLLGYVDAWTDTTTVASLERNILNAAHTVLSERGVNDFAKPLLANPALVPGCEAQRQTSAQYQEFLRIKASSPLFSLPTAAQVQQRVSFPLSGTAGQTPGVITMHLDGAGLGAYRSVTVVINATPDSRKQTVASLAGTTERLHPVQANGADPVVRQSAFDPASGTFTVPARTVAVFVQG